MMIPSLFLAHGSPMLAIENAEYAQFITKYAEQLAPKAIVIFSAHWESEILTISDTDEVYDTIYDFGGFPDELYQIKYPAKGSRALAAMLKQRFEQQGIAVRTDAHRGLDHGSWTLLYRMFPQADIPVIQISVHPFLHPQEQFRIGEALRGLGDQDILIIGSGVTVHNLGMVRWRQTEPEPWAVQFDDWLIEHIRNRDLDSLFNYETLAPCARQAVPRPEHFVPLFIAMGSGQSEAEAKVIHRSYQLGSISNISFEF